MHTGGCRLLVQHIYISSFFKRYKGNHVPVDHFTDYIENINTIFLRSIPSTVETDFNLIVQADGFAVNPQAWDPLFWNYDYIGAPFCGFGVAALTGVDQSSAMAASRFAAESSTRRSSISI